MSRYFRLYLSFIRFSFSRAMEFRVDFFFRIFGDTLYYAVSFFFFKTLFLHSPLIGGWNESQTVIFVASFLMVDAIQMTVLINNMWHLSDFVRKGELDYYLLRPVSPIFMLSFRDFAANSFVNLIMAFGILGWAFHNYPEPISLGRILLYGISLGLGFFLYYFIELASVIPVFWMHGGRGFQPLFWVAVRFMERPDGIFKGWTRRILISILPFSLVASYPTRVLFEENPWPSFFHVFLAACGFGIFISLLWRQALRTYSSASS